MKYNGNIFSCQVPENWKTHEYMRFFTYKPFGKLFYKNPILFILQYIYAIKMYYF